MSGVLCMSRAKSLWLKVVLPGLLAACLSTWAAVALEAAGVISLAKCDRSSCTSSFVFITPATSRF